MAINLDYYTNMYFSNGEDAPYEVRKGGTLTIKPILVKECFLYEWAKSVLLINKNEIEDPSVISMSYLEFLITQIFNEDINPSHEEYLSQFLWIIEHCLGYTNVSINREGKKTCLVLANEEDVIEKIVTPKEFDDISVIILNQNDPSYDGRYVAPEVRELMADFYRAKYRDIGKPSLEKRKAFVCSKLGKNFKEIGEMTCREFELIYDEALSSEMYIGEKIIQGSFKYDVKEDIVHPLFRKKTDPYAEAFEDTSILSSKGIAGAEQLMALNLQQD